MDYRVVVGQRFRGVECANSPIVLARRFSAKEDWIASEEGIEVDEELVLCTLDPEKVSMSL